MTRDDIIRMAKEAGLLDMDYELGDWEIHEFTVFAKLVAAAEREACADLCATFYDEMWKEHAEAGNQLAEAIRARGQQ